MSAGHKGVFTAIGFYDGIITSDITIGGTTYVAGTDTLEDVVFALATLLTDGYNQSFIIADWVNAGAVSTITIPIGTHNQGENPIVQTYLSTGAKEEINNVYRSATDVIIEVLAGAEFDGEVSILKTV